MTREHKRYVNNNRKTKKSSTSGKIERDLKDIVEFQKQQIRFGQPNTPDIMFPVIRQQTYVVACNYNVGAINQGTGGSTGAFTFSLNLLPAYSSFTNLFDRYQVLQWNLQFNPVQLTSSINQSAPLITAIDYDDANAGVAEIQQRDTAMAVPIGTYFERTLQPRVALAAYAGTGFNSYANMDPRDMWYDTASTAIQSYGLKYYLGSASASSIQIYTVSARIHLRFKNNF